MTTPRPSSPPPAAPTPGPATVHGASIHLHNPDGGYLSLDCGYPDRAAEIARRWNARSALLAARGPS